MNKPNNLVPIAMLWGTEELKAEVGECERLEIRHIFAGSESIAVNYDGVYKWKNNSELPHIAIVRKPTWTWCENPTDEMARLRPRCEVRDRLTDEWLPAVLFAVVTTDESTFPYTAKIDSTVRGYKTCGSSYVQCRVRLSANGEVMVDWEGEE